MALGRCPGLGCFALSELEENQYKLLLKNVLKKKPTPDSPQMGDTLKTKTLPALKLRYKKGTQQLTPAYLTSYIFSPSPPKIKPKTSLPPSQITLNKNNGTLTIT